MQIIKENTISMTFWANARIFSTKFFFGQSFLDGGSMIQHAHRAMILTIHEGYIVAQPITFAKLYGGGSCNINFGVKSMSRNNTIMHSKMGSQYIR